ncbi:MAG: FxsA family protein [Granulosicoccus sp.]
MPLALLLFIAMPIVEIAILLRVGSAIGWVTTLLIVIVTAVVGSAMLRQQGLATLNTARSRLNAGEMPAQQLMEGVMIMIGGVLLLTPGFVTDAFGFACLIPLTRQWLASRIASRVNVSAGGGGFTGGESFGADVFSRSDSHPHRQYQQTRESGPSRGGKGNETTGEVIDGEYRRLDDDD